MSLARTYRIETERLTIRCYEPGDAEKLQTAIIASIDHLRPWMPWVREEPKDLEFRINLIRQFRGQFDLGQDYVFGIFNREGTELIGGTGLHMRIARDAAGGSAEGPSSDRLPGRVIFPGTRPGNAIDAREIGYWIGAGHINQGYATEAVKALIRVGFEIEGLSRVEIHCIPGNLRSRHIPEKLGFRQEAPLKAQSRDDQGRPVDTLVWSLSRSEYEQSVLCHAAVRAFDILGREIAIAKGLVPDAGDLNGPGTNGSVQPRLPS